MALCSVSPAIYEKLQISILKRLENIDADPNGVFDPNSIIKDIYYRIYEGKNKDRKNALSVSQHVPSAIIAVTASNRELTARLLKKAKDPNVLGKLYELNNEFVKNIESVANLVDPKLGYKKKLFESITKPELEVSETKEQVDNQYDNVEYVLNSMDLMEPVDFFSTFFREVLKDAEGNFTSDRDPNYAFIYNSFRKILSALKTSKLNNASTLTYDNHTGFRLKLYSAADPAIADLRFISPNDKVPPSAQYLLALTDNEGNILKFNQDGRINMTDGKMVYFYLRTKATSSFADQAVAIRKNQIAKNFKNDPEGLEKALNNFRTLISDMRNNSVKDVQGITARFERGEEILLDITGGKKGFYNKTPVDFNTVYPTLTENEIDSIDLIKTPGANKGYLSVRLEGVDEPVVITPSKPLKASSDLLLNIAQVLTYKGTDINTNDKLAYFNKFIFPKVRDINSPNPGILIDKDENDNLVLQIRNEEIDLNTITPEDLANKLSGSYIRIPSELIKDKLYEKYTVVDDRIIINPDQDYIKLIKDNLRIYAKPNIRTVNGETVVDRIAEVNGYFTWRPVTEYYTKAANDLQTENKKDITTNDQDAWEASYMNKIIREFGTPGQQAIADEWWKTSPLSTAKDSQGKLLIPLHVLFNIVNSKGWARWSLSGIELFQGSDYTHLYHESWHAFSQLYLTKAEKKALYKETSELTGSFKIPTKILSTDGTESYEFREVKFADATETELEEFIAEEFRKYAIAKGDMKINESVRKNIFQRIWEFLKRLFTGYTASQVANQPETVKPLKEIFEKLYVGDILNYTPSIDNVIFNTANAGILHVENPEEDRNVLDSKLITNSIDGYISKYISHHAFNKDTATDKGGFVKIFKDKSAMSEIYYKALQNFISRRDYLQTQRDKEQDLQKQNTLDRQLDILQWTINNYGDINKSLTGNEVRGVIAYHLKNSVFKNHINKFTSDKIDEDDIENLTENSSRNIIDKRSDVNLEEEADIMTLWLIESLIEQEKVGEDQYRDVKNELGFPKLADPKLSIRTLVKNIAGEKRQMPMYNNLVKLSKRFPIFNQLVEKLGNPSQPMNDMQRSLWAKFMQDFNKHTVKIYRTVIEAEFVPSEGEEGEGERDWKIKIGHAAGDDARVYRDWRTSFALRKPSAEDPYVKESYTKNVKTIVLNPRAIEEEFLKLSAGDYVLQDYSRKFDFLKAIGITISEDPNLRQAFDDFNMDETVGYIANLIGNASKKALLINDPIKYLSQAGAVESRLRTLAKLEANYSDKYNTLMRLAPGDRKIYEQNLNSTATQKTYAINASKDFTDLMTNPDFRHMRFLSPIGKKMLGFISSNPWTESSISLNSIYNLSTDDRGKYGKKFKKNNKDVTIDIISLVGSEVLDINEYVGDGLAHVNMSRADKFISDFYSVLKSGVFEQQRHGNKSSYFGTKLSKIKTYEGKYNDALYADHFLFVSPENSNEYRGFNRMYPYILKYATSELLRIYEYNKNKDIYDTWTNFEGAGEFAIFDKLLSDKVKEILKSDKVKNEINKPSSDIRSYTYLNMILSKPEFKELDKLIRSDIKNYFDNYIARLDEFTFSNYRDKIVPDLYESLKQTMPGEELTQTQMEQAMLRSFAYNTWFNYVEQTVIHYGDPFFFKHEKEEAAKRMQTIFATGKTFLYDEIGVNWAKQIGRPYYDKLVAEGKITPNEFARTKEFDGRLHTAVLKDPTPDSIYVNIFEETFRRALINEGKSEEVVNKELYGEDGTSKNPTGGFIAPYYKMKEADGAALISFDTYRLLKKLAGQWSEDIQEQLYQRILNGEKIELKEVLEIFPVYKLQMSGQLAHEQDLLPVTAIHKFALIPFIPSVYKNTGLEKLHNKMMEQGIDYVLFKSGSKISTITNNKERESDVAFLNGNTNYFNDNLELTDNPIYIAYLKDQLELGNNFKDYATFSSQMRRILTYGLYEGGKPIDYKGTYEDWINLSEAQQLKQSKYHTLAEKFRVGIDRMVDYEKSKLMEEIGWKIKDGKYVGSDKALIDFIKDEMKEEGFSEHEINYITYDDNMNQTYTTVSLDTSFDSERIEKMLLGIINNRIVKQKLKGEPFVEMSGAFANSTNSDFYTPTKEQYEKYKFSHPDSLKNYEEYLEMLQNEYGTSGLPFYRPMLGSAMKAMKVKVALRGDYTNLLNLIHIDGNKIAVFDTVKKLVNGKEIDEKVLNVEASRNRLNQCIKDENWLNIGDHRSMITITGLRIPLQYINSMEYAEILEFLPEEAGPIMILPSEIVVKTGTDFDVDKLTSYIAHITRNGKFVKDEFDTPEEIMDRINDVLDRRDEEIIKLTGEEITAKKLIKAVRQGIKEKKALDRQNFEMLIAQKNAIRSRFDIIINDKVLKDLNLEKNKSRITRRLNKAIYQISNTVDIYNVLSDFKQLEDKSNYKLLSKGGKAELKKAGKLKEELDEIFKVIEEASAEYKENLEQIEPTIDIIKQLTNEYEDLYYQYRNFKSGIQNSLMQTMREILELPMNSYRMLKPNSVHHLKPIAEKLEDKVQVIKFRDQNGKLSPTTTMLEYDYQLKRHQDGIIAGASLGISANTNTFNTQNNEGGNYIPEYTQLKYYAYNRENTVKVKSVLYFKHNTTTRKNKAGKKVKVISLSNLYDSNNAIEIGELINEFISGFVDAESENWPAYIQGNRETIPTTLNIVESGVDIETAIFFVSNPLVRKYISTAQDKKGIFSRFTREGKTKFYKSAAAKEVLRGINFEELGVESKYTINPEDKNEYSVIDNRVARYMLMKDLKEKLYGKKLITKTDLFKLITTPEGKKTIEQKQKDLLMLLHFIYINDMFMSNDQLKQIAKPDRNRITSLFDAQIRKNALKRLRESGTISPEQVDYHMQKSSLRSAYQEEFALELFGPLFKLTNNSVFNNFLEGMTTNFKVMQAIEDKTGMDDEKYAKRFREDFTLFLMTNYIKQLVPGKSGYYKGLRINDTAKVEYAEGFGPTSVFVKKYNGQDTIFVNLAQIRDEFLNKDYTPGNKKLNSSYRINGLAAVNDGFFTNERDYYNFVLEREYLRYLTLVEELIQDKDFTDMVKAITEQNPKSEKTDIVEYEAAVRKLAYENVLRDRALDNSLNFAKMFESGKETYAARLEQILEDFDFLAGDYPVLQKYVPRTKTDRRGLVSANKAFYLTFQDISTIDADETEEYHNQLLDLSNESIMKVKGNTEKAKRDNKYISDFFKRISLYAFLESGLKAGPYSFTKIVPTKPYQEIINEVMKSMGPVTPGLLDIYNTKLLQRYQLKNLKDAKLPFDYTLDIDTDIIAQEDRKLELYLKTKEKNNTRADKFRVESSLIRDFIRPTDKENIFNLSESVLVRDNEGKIMKDKKGNPITISLYDIPVSEQELAQTIRGYRLRTNLQIILDALGPDYYAVMDDSITRELPTTSLENKRKENRLLKFGKLTTVPKNIKFELNDRGVSGNEVAGVRFEASEEAKQLLNNGSPRLFDMTKAGIRTRMTKTKGEMEQLEEKLGRALEVGDYINIVDKDSGEFVPVRVTGIYGKNDKGWNTTWDQEGLRKEDKGVFDRYQKGAKAIAFTSVSQVLGIRTLKYTEKQGKGTLEALNVENNYKLAQEKLEEDIKTMKDLYQRGKKLMFLTTGYGQGYLSNAQKLTQESGRNLPTLIQKTELEISKNDIADLQRTVENQLLNESLADELNWKTMKPYVVLSSKASEKFINYLSKSRGAYPKDFFDDANQLSYIKSNNRKNSLLYDVVDKRTGELYREKVRIYLSSEFESYNVKGKIADEYGLNFKPTKVFSANRSIAFSLYRSKPSKSKYSAMAKKYLYDAIKMVDKEQTGTAPFINLDKISSFLDVFPKDMWDYVNTTYSPEDSTRINASTSLANNIKFKLPKLGLLQEIEKITGIKLQDVGFKNYDRSGKIKKMFKVEWGDLVVIDPASMSEKQLRYAIGYYLKTKDYFKPSSTEQNVKKYAEHRNIDYNELRELVFGDIDKAIENIAYNQTGNSDEMEVAKWRDEIKNYDWQAVELFHIPYKNFKQKAVERITEKFKDKILSNGISHLDYFFTGNFNWLNINLNNISGEYYSTEVGSEAEIPSNVGFDIRHTRLGEPIQIFKKPKVGKDYLREKEVFNRLAAVIHEPFHALHALTYGTKNELEMRKAFDRLYNTDFGRRMMEEVFGSGYNKGQQLDYSTLYKEFTAFSFQLMMYPKQWIHKTDLRSNDIYEFIEKIQNLQDKTYKEIVKTKGKIGTTERTVQTEEEIKLSFLDRLYNLIVQALHDVLPLSKKFMQLLKTTKVVESKVIDDVFGEVEEEVTRTVKLPENVKKSKEEFLSAMDDLRVAISTLLTTDSELFSSKNITKFFTKEQSFYQEANDDQVPLEDQIIYLEEELKDLESLKRELLDSSLEGIVVNAMPKITPESAQKETGGKIGTGRDINPSLVSKDGLTVKEAAHVIWETNFADEGRYDDQDVRNVIIDILSYGKQGFIDDLVNQRAIDNIKNDIYEKKALLKERNKKEAQKIVETPVKEIAPPPTIKANNPLSQIGVKPTDMKGNAAKDLQMAQEAVDSEDGQFIGFGTVSKPGATSSTNKYATGWGFKANTGKYTSKSVIMVSSSGTFGRGGVSIDKEGKAIRSTATSKYKPLLDEAVKAGASFRVGNNYEKGVDKDVALAKVSKGEYIKGNYGDALIAVYLKAKGYTEERLEGYSRWMPKTVEQVVTQQIQTAPKEIIEPGLDLYKNALTKEEQKEFYNFGKTVLEKNGYNPFPQYVMASAGELEWSPEEVINKNGELITRSGNYDKSITSFRKKQTNSDGEQPRWIYHYYKSNFDGTPITPIPVNIIKILEKITGQNMSDYDTVLINLYPIGRTLGWHQDVTEDYRNMNRDIISVSIGANADFTYKNDGLKFLPGAPKGKLNPVNVKSGDVITFGGPARLIRHTVTKVTGTTDLGSINLNNSNVNTNFNDGKLLLNNWRMNFTFRVASPNKNKGKRTNTEPVIQNVETARTIYAKLGNKTQSENVEIPGKGDLKDVTYNSKTFWSEVVPEARGQFGDQLIIAYRGNRQKSFLQNYREGFPGITIGNPFDWQSETGTRDEQGIKSTKRFIHWMITGDNMGITEATPEYRQAIINDIKNGKLKRRPIIYYQEKGYATHATALDYLINKYNWEQPTIQPTVQPIELKSKPVPKIGDVVNIEFYFEKEDKTTFVKAKIKELEKVYQGATVVKDNKGNIVSQEEGTPEYFVTLENLDNNRTYEFAIGEDGYITQTLGKNNKTFVGTNNYISEFDFTKSSKPITPTPEPKMETGSIQKSGSKGEFFVYLSKRLAEEFNYSNPNSQGNKDIQDIFITRRPLTQEEIEEAKQNCKSKLS